MANFNQSCEGGRVFRGDRLEALMQQRGISQSELARRVGVSATSIWKLIKEPSQGTKHLHRIARELETTAEYLMGEVDEVSPLLVGDQRLAFYGKPLEPKPAPDTVELTEFDVSFGLGATYIHDVPVTGRQRIFSRSWIRQFTDASVDSLFWATGNGGSMVPAILDSDILLIDTSQRTPRMWDQFWAIEMHGMGMIKALRPGKDGAMRIISINPDWPEEVAYDGEMNVIGRVVAIVRKC